MNIKQKMLIVSSMYFVLTHHAVATPSETKTLVSKLEQPLVIAEKFSIRSTLLAQDRDFYLHLPSGYPRKGQRYPVLFIPDGARKMQKTVAITDDLATFGHRIPEMIVVGIETNKNRTADLSTEESSVKFLNFITQELKPYIEQHYQTNGENLLMGSSMGGEFVIRALLEQPQAFDGYFAISPSVYYSDFKLVEKAIEWSKSGESISSGFADKKLYLSVANEGWNQGVDELAYQLKKHPIKGLTWQFNKQLNESHGSISLKQGYADLQAYYAKWADLHFEDIADFEQRGGIEFVKRHYQRKNRPIPISVLDHMALLYLDNKQSKQSIALQKLAIAQHPKSGRVFRNIAHVYEKLGMFSEAKLALENALSVATANKHRASSIASHQNALKALNDKYPIKR